MIRALASVAIIVGFVLLVESIMQPPWGSQMVVAALLVLAGGYVFLKGG
jgi:hypothetical protein